MKSKKNSYFKYFSLFFAMIVLVLVVGCSGPTPTTGTIEVNSTPIGAKIYLDGVDTGMATPFTITNVEAGSHVIKLDASHYKIWEETVIVTANQTTYLNPLLTYATQSTITLQPDAEGKDAVVLSDEPTILWGDREDLYLGKEISGTQHYYWRSYLQFNLSTVPGNARVVTAYLSLYQFSSSGSASNNTIGLYQVTSDWEESTITWNNQPTSSTVVESSCAVFTFNNTWRGWYNIGDLVQGWLDDITNQGMLLKATDETIDLAVGCYSSDYTTDTTKRPKLVIDYYIP